MIHFYLFPYFKKGISVFSLFFFILTFVLSTGCRNGKHEDNVILITLDTQRADYISAYRSDKASTPNIDFLAEQGTLYENAFSLIPITLPSHGSIFFSQTPNELKSYNNGHNIRTKKKRPSFVNLFKKEGFKTGAFVSLGVLKSHFGLSEGFDFYEDSFPKGKWYIPAARVNEKAFPWIKENRHDKFFLWLHYSDPHDPYAPPYLPSDLKLFLNDQLIGEFGLNKYKIHEIDLELKPGRNRLRWEIMNEYAEKNDSFHARLDKLDFSVSPDDPDFNIDFARGWMLRRKDTIFFAKNDAWIDITNHKTSPDKVRMTWRGRIVLPTYGTRELYRSEVEYMDEHIGELWELLKELHLFDKTMIVMAGDHGEGLGEYTGYFRQNHIGHIHFLYDIYLKVPLIVYDPNAPNRGVRRTEPVSLLDIAPTITGHMGFKHFPHFQGRDLGKLPEGENRAVMQATYKPEALRNKFGIRLYPWHLIFTPEQRHYELYDLAEDAMEKNNLFVNGGMPEEAAPLKRKLDETVREILKSKQEIKIDSDTKEMLRVLGYIK